MRQSGFAYLGRPEKRNRGKSGKRSLITGLIALSIIPCNYAMQRHDYKVHLRKTTQGVRQSRRSILALLHGRADEQFYLREIARRAGTGIGATQPELEQLTGAGLLCRVQRGHQVYYRATLPAGPISS